MLGSMMSLASAATAGAEEPAPEVPEAPEAALPASSVSCFSPPAHSFTDVVPASYYELSVSWLVASEITTGVTADRYAPNNQVTRGQMAAFLWRANGTPAPAQPNNFTDVPADAYYSTAVSWLVGEGITTGTSEGKFSPNNKVSRGQMASFLHRAAGSPVAASDHSFSDVAADAYYDGAVSWLLEAGITTGVSANLFAPNSIVTRAQMAVFLHRNACGPKPVSVDSGERHTCVLKEFGTVACFGNNNDGQIGDGTNTGRTAPVLVRGVSNAKAIATGSFHSCAAKTDGSVVCWGSNNNGQLGDGTTTNRNLPVTVNGLSGVTGITAGVDHTCATKDDGTVACWGYNGDGQLGDDSFTNRTTPIIVGGGLSGVKSVAAGAWHNCAAKTDGTVACWGRNAYGQLGNGTNTLAKLPVDVADLSGVTALVGGWDNTCALNSDGTVACWGANGNGELGLGGGAARNTPTTIPDLGGVTALGGGAYHNCAVKDDGTAECWGYNKDGEIGDGSATKRLSPVAVVGLTDAKAIAGGSYNSCAVTASGATFCWGFNGSGQLGDGTTTKRLTPTEVAYPNPIVR